MHHMYIYRQNLSQQTTEVIAPNPPRLWVGMQALEQTALCNAKDLLLDLSKV